MNSGFTISGKNIYPQGKDAKENKKKCKTFSCDVCTARKYVKMKL
jgi:hypothetical protein